MRLNVVTMLIILHTGARQNILAWVVLTTITFWKGKWKIPIAVMFLSVMATSIFVLSSKMESLGALFSQSNTVGGIYEASGRAIHAAKAWEYFLSSPLSWYWIWIPRLRRRWSMGAQYFSGSSCGVWAFGVLHSTCNSGNSLFGVSDMKQKRGLILVLIPFFVRAFVSESLALNIAVLTLIIFYHRTEHEQAEL